MIMPVDPSKISLNSSGDVVIDDTKLLDQISKVTFVSTWEKTNDSQCNGTNTVCNNIASCSGSSNAARCSNSGGCVI